MLAFFRRAMSSWLMLGIVGFLVVAFIITGIGNPIGGPKSPEVAIVGDKTITEAEVAIQFDRFIRAEQQKAPDFNGAQAVRLGVFDQLLEQLIAANATSQFGQMIGLGVSDNFVDAQIKALPVFQTDGKFDEKRFQTLIAQQNLGVQDVREDFRKSAVIQQILAPLRLGVPAPHGIARPYADLLLERRSGAVGFVSTASFMDKMHDKKATPEQLKAFYEKHIARYTTKEKRAFDYIELNKRDFAKKVEVSPEEIAAYYKSHAKDYGGVEHRRVSQIVLPDEAAAQKLMDQIKRGTSFEEAATKSSDYTKADLMLGEKSQQDLSIMLGDRIAAAVFKATSGETVGPLHSSLGWHVLKIDGVIPAKPEPIEKVKQEIATKLHDEKTEALFTKSFNQIEDSVADGKKLADVASSAGLHLVQVPPTVRDAQTSKAEKGDDVTHTLLPNIFEISPEEGVMTLETGPDSFALVAVRQIIPPTPEPFDNIRGIVLQQWRQDQAAQMAGDLAHKIAAKVKNEADMKAAFKEHGLPAPRMIPSQRRIDLVQKQGGSTPILALYLSLAQGQAKAIYIPERQGYNIVYVAKIEREKESADNKSLTEVRQKMQEQMSRSLIDDLAFQFTRATEKAVRVEHNPSTIARMKQAYLGGGNAAGTAGKVGAP